MGRQYAGYEVNRRNGVLATFMFSPCAMKTGELKIMTKIHKKNTEKIVLLSVLKLVNLKCLITMLVLKPGSH